MRQGSRLEKEIENISSDGSRRNEILKRFPYEKDIQVIKKDLTYFKLKVWKTSMRNFNDFVPYIKEHLEDFGAIYGEVKIGKPESLSSGEHSIKVKYNFLDKVVEDVVKFSSEELKYAENDINEDFVYCFKENHVQKLGDGKYILR